jgi:hypothetical protein
VLPSARRDTTASSGILTGHQDPAKATAMGTAKATATAMAMAMAMAMGTMGR